MSPAARSSARPSTRPPTPGDALAARVRQVLAAGPDVREVRMFGGLSFMVGGRMACAAGGDGSLLVRTDPAAHDELLARGAEPAVMGTDRPMGPGWVRVPPARLAADDDLAGWVGVGTGSGPSAG